MKNACDWLNWLVPTIEGWKLFFDFLKNLIWPAFLFWAILKFKSNIDNVFKNIIKIGPGGVELQAQNLRNQELSEISKKIKRFDFVGQEKSKALIDLESELLDSFRNIDGNQYLKGKNTEEGFSFLISHLADARLSYLYERANRIIFPGQIKLLVDLNLDSIKIEDLRRNFSKYTQEFSGEEILFDSWFNFLLNQRFVDVRDGMISINAIGREFLEFLDGIRSPTKS